MGSSESAEAGEEEFSLVALECGAEDVELETMEWDVEEMKG